MQLNFFYEYEKRLSEYRDTVSVMAIEITELEDEIKQLNREKQALKYLLRECDEERIEARSSHLTADTESHILYMENKRLKEELKHLKAFITVGEGI